MLLLDWKRTKLVGWKKSHVYRKKKKRNSWSWSWDASSDLCHYVSAARNQVPPNVATGYSSVGLKAHFVIIPIGLNYLYPSPSLSLSLFLCFSLILHKTYLETQTLFPCHIPYLQSFTYISLAAVPPITRWTNWTTSHMVHIRSSLCASKQLQDSNPR